MRNGYTLTEILVVVGLIAVVGTILTQIFFQTLKGGNQAKVLAEIKQNGLSILETMDKNIRNADGIVCISDLGDALVINNQGVNTRYRFNPPRPSDKPTSNGFIYQDQGNNCDLIVPLTEPPLNAKLLTNFDAQEGISVLNGKFSLDIKYGFKDVLTISFEIRPGEKAVYKAIDPVPFSTTIQLR